MLINLSLFIIYLLISYTLFNISGNFSRKYKFFSVSYFLLGLSHFFSLIIDLMHFNGTLREISYIINSKLVPTSFYYHFVEYLSILALFLGLISLYLNSQKSRGRLLRTIEINQIILFIMMTIMLSYASFVKNIFFNLFTFSTLFLTSLNVYKNTKFNYYILSLLILSLGYGLNLPYLVIIGSFIILCRTLAVYNQ